MKPVNYIELVPLCLNGDKKAVEMLIISIQQQVYNLAVRFLWEPADAQDATQEILIKVLTNLSKFRGESSFTTWVYRIATNYLLNKKRTKTEDLTFEEGKKHLALGATYPAYEEADKNLLEDEVKIACSTSMLICVARPLRLAYLIGEVLEFNSQEGAFILEIEPATFRKRLSLARQRIRAFMAQQCGLFDPTNPCRCAKHITYSIKVDWFKPNKLKFADKGKVETTKLEIETLMNDTAIFQSHPDYHTPENILDGVKSLLDSGKFPLLTEDT
ncbi:MAG: RNA polymerase sigma factor [Thermonemataceae bacterium]